MFVRSLIAFAALGTAAMPAQAASTGTCRTQVTEVCQTHSGLPSICIREGVAACKHLQSKPASPDATHRLVFNKETDKWLEMEVQRKSSIFHGNETLRDNAFSDGEDGDNDDSDGDEDGGIIGKISG